MSAGRVARRSGGWSAGACRGFVFVARLVLGGLLLWSSLPKIRHPYGFLTNVYDYELVGARLGAFIAMTLPWLELVLGLCLISGLFVGGALLACVGLMAMILFAQGSVLSRDLSVACLDFHTADPGPVDYGTFARTSGVLVMALLGYGLVVFRGGLSGPGEADSAVERRVGGEG